VFTAPEENVGQINKALAAGTVPVIALSSDSTKTLAQGRLALVDNKVDQASGTIQMKATFENKDNALWPGLSVATRLLIDTQRNVLVISNDAIQHGPNGLYSFVVGKDNKVEKSDIEVGDEGTSQSVVRKGLASGDRVVTTGQYRLTEGALVTPRNANPSSSPDKEAANTAQKEP
jgi:multidrug efflux system membrane fusion protein